MHMQRVRLGIAWVAPFLVISLALLSGCSEVRADGTAKAGDDEAVAYVAGEKLTMADLETRLSQELEQLARQRRELLEQGLNVLVEERLLEREAKRQKQTVEELLAAEMASVEEVTDADVDTWYEKNKARVNRPKEAIAGQIRAYLQQEQRGTVRAALLERLRRETSVRTLLEPWRIDVAADGFPAKGAESAPVTLVEFSDFQCPGCRSMTSVLDEVVERYGSQVRLVYRHLPLISIHPEARAAAEASLCAAREGRFWEMHDALFASQRELAREDLLQRAKELQLDMAKFERCMESEEIRAAVETDRKAAIEAGINSTPTILVNGRPVSFRGAAPPADQIGALIEDELRRLGVEGP